ncbi:MAG TPA: hypothetical protein VHS09_04790 [Polyangiaceae bacterium]|nr:hypothetical protein [Polyangiaceae bacterium]
MATQKATRTSTASGAEALSEGTTKHFPNASQSLAVGGGTYTVTDVTTKLGQIVSLRSATVAAQVSAKAKVAAERTQLPPLLLFMAAYVAFVKATFGQSPDALADFGLVPRKVRKPLTAEQLAAAKAKRIATRAARGTVGSTKKALITGNVVGVTVTPITAPAAEPSSPPLPASAPATGATAASPAGAAAPTPHS